ncbi:hypothetical protein [Aliivibrio fischeri]|uniref:hypothetical protein n=1 Tax=Aliivibrio fischeri TaxID=668 RepID=UPI0002EF54EE|nr:hypothetical protein [Aliivibrio fischeri]OEE14449.1 hypothetical protein A1Q3_16995 [Aliivibrio fischeri ZF-211]
MKSVDINLNETSILSATLMQSLYIRELVCIQKGETFDTVKEMAVVMEQWSNLKNHLDSEIHLQVNS